jgi:hypothetical protein
MIEVELTARSLIVRMQGINRFLALRRQVECSLANVQAVTTGISPELRELPLRATRKVGTRLLLRNNPIILGSFGTRSGGDYFYAIRTGDRAITITLDHERYRALVLEVDDPAALAHAITAAAERAKAIAGTVS